ncbi:SixA phosphatase family protein [Aliagarivorans taiwanensis]|uniref:SixA phosphatase family protein n=1 Tax=Aliagarivorans taiwanensis TaxID=561966 RepID=UPI0003FB3E69|nr:histidine phosphatase family protein [Aliagarivorans taiwanensis]
MPRQLWLIRHAKSSWDDLSLDDHQRPLAARGVNAANKMALRHLAELSQVERCFCSTATRAKQTLALFQQQGALPDSQYLDPLYTFDDKALLRELQAIPDALTEIAVLGHNPAIHELVEWLTGETIVKLPTCAVIKLECDIASWSALSDDCAYLALFSVARRPRS